MKTDELLDQLKEKDEELSQLNEDLRVQREDNLMMQARIRELEDMAGLDASANFVGNASLLGLPVNSLSGSMQGQKNNR